MEVIEWAHRAGISLLNMHLNNGIYFTLPDRKVWINEQYETEFSDLLYDSYIQLCHYAKKFNVQLCIENTCNFHIPFVTRAIKRLKQLDNLCFTWDVGHDAKANYQEMPIMMELSERIWHMNLHDYNGKSDHQTLFTGEIPIEERLDFAKKNRVLVVIEVKTSTSLIESVNRLKGNHIYAPETIL